MLGFKFGIYVFAILLSTSVTLHIISKGLFHLISFHLQFQVDCFSRDVNFHIIRETPDTGFYNRQFFKFFNKDDSLRILEMLSSNLSGQKYYLTD